MRATLLLITVFLTGCAASTYTPIVLKVNPYENMAPKELKKISGMKLCESVKNPYFIESLPGSNLSKELDKRGYKDCSSDEVYCIDELYLKPGTPPYTHCRLERDRLNLETTKVEQNTRYQNELIAQAKRPKRIIINHINW
jgi:hypothetical protein